MTHNVQCDKTLSVVRSPHAKAERRAHKIWRALFPSGATELECAPRACIFAELFTLAPRIPAVTRFPLRNHHLLTHRLTSLTLQQEGALVSVSSRPWRGCLACRLGFSFKFKPIWRARLFDGTADFTLRLWSLSASCSRFECNHLVSFEGTEALFSCRLIYPHRATGDEPKLDHTWMFRRSWPVRRDDLSQPEPTWGWWGPANM